MVISAFDAGREALRWVTGAAVPAAGGATWPVTRAAGAASSDDLYDGTAGVLFALAEARLSGIADFDSRADAAAGRLRSLVAARSGGGPAPAAADNGLYTGLSGHAAALHAWASVSADDRAAAAARDAIRSLTAITERGGRVSADRDLLSGEAGILLALVGIGGSAARPAAAVIADRLIAEAEWPDGEPDWYLTDGFSYFMPNFSHGAAGIAYALASASGPLDRPDFLQVALLAGRRLVRLGGRPDGTLAVPNRIPPGGSAAPVSYGWCHGPAAPSGCSGCSAGCGRARGGPSRPRRPAGPCARAGCLSGATRDSGTTSGSAAGRREWARWRSTGTRRPATRSGWPGRRHWPAMSWAGASPMRPACAGRRPSTRPARLSWSRRSAGCRARPESPAGCSASRGWSETARPPGGSGGRTARP